MKRILFLSIAFFCKTSAMEENLEKTVDFTFRNNTTEMLSCFCLSSERSDACECFVLSSKTQKKFSLAYKKFPFFSVFNLDNTIEEEVDLRQLKITAEVTSAFIDIITSDDGFTITAPMSPTSTKKHPLFSKRTSPSSSHQDKKSKN